MQRARNFLKKIHTKHLPVLWHRQWIRNNLLTFKDKEMVKRIKKHGKSFLNSYKKKAFGPRNRFSLKLFSPEWDSPVGIALFEKNIDGRKKIASACLDFEENTVKILSIQGTKEAQKDLQMFSLMNKMSWANFLVKEIEQHARNEGYKKAKILRPEFQKFYKEPFIDPFIDMPKLNKKLKESMQKKFGENLAWMEHEKWISYTKEIEEIQKEFIEKIRTNMRKLYYGLAKKEGYRKNKEYFEKTL